MRSVLAASGLLLLTLTITASAGVNTWTVVGPEGGHSHTVAFDPTQQNVVLMSADSSVYRSTNLGQSWTTIRDDIPGGFARVRFDPTNANRVIALGDGLHRSTDGGRTFARLDAPANLRTPLAVAADGTVYAGTIAGGVLESTDFGDHWTDSSTGVPPGLVGLVDLVTDPQNANVLYAIVQSQGLYKSADAGASWTLQNTLAFGAFNLAVDPGISDELLIASQNGVFASHDGGATWALEHAGAYAWVGYLPSVFIGGAVALPFYEGHAIRRAGRGLAWVDGELLKLQSVEDAAFDPHSLNAISSTLLVASGEGPLLTQDGAMTFELRAGGLRGGTVFELAATSGPNGAVYAAFGTGPYGIYRRSGSVWLPVDNHELRARIPEPFAPLELAVAPGQPDTVFVSSGTSLVSSTDGGSTWTPPHADFAVTRIPVAIAFAPSNPRVLYVGTASQGIYRTDDQGVTWTPRSTGLPAARNLWDVAVDPLHDGIAYAAVDPLPPADNFFKTSDAGIGWAPSGGTNLGSVGRIVVDPTNANVLYAIGGGANQGLFKSTNGAQTWSRVGGQQGHGPVVDVAVDPVVPTTIFLAGNPNGRGAARSVDGGTLWENVDLSAPAGFGFPMSALVLDPLRPHVAIAAVASYGIVEIEISPDLEASIVSAPPRVPLSGAGSATVRVTNRGPYAASAVELRIDVPPGVAALAAPPGHSCAPAGAALLCSLGAMRVNTFIDVIVPFTGSSAPANGMLVATVAAHEPDSLHSNNTAAVAVAAERVANLGVLLVDAADPVTSGSTVQYTATVTNAGPNDATGTSVTLQFDGMTASSAVPSQGSCVVASPIVTCALGALAVGSNVTIAIAGPVGAVATATASASVSFAGVDPVAANDTATQGTTVSATPTPPPSGGSGNNGGTSSNNGGGGGASGLLELAAMLALLAAARRPSRVHPLRGFFSRAVCFGFNASCVRALSCGASRLRRFAAPTCWCAINVKFASRHGMSEKVVPAALEHIGNIMRTRFLAPSRLHSRHSLRR